MYSYFDSRVLADIQHIQPGNHPPTRATLFSSAPAKLDVIGYNGVPPTSNGVEILQALTLHTRHGRELLALVRYNAAALQLQESCRPSFHPLRLLQHPPKAARHVPPLSTYPPKDMSSPLTLPTPLSTTLPLPPAHLPAPTSRLPAPLHPPPSRSPPRPIPPPTPPKEVRTSHRESTPSPTTRAGRGLPGQRHVGLVTHFPPPIRSHASTPS